MARNKSECFFLNTV